MSRLDYAHWNEEQDRVWWEEEGRHAYEGEDYNDLEGDRAAEQAEEFAASVEEMTTLEIAQHLSDPEYCSRWPKAVPILRDALDERTAEDGDPLD